MSQTPRAGRPTIGSADHLPGRPTWPLGRLTLTAHQAAQGPGCLTLPQRQFLPACKETQNMLNATIGSSIQCIQGSKGHHTRD